MAWNDDEPEFDEFEDETTEESDELPCPSCGRAIYADTDRCPHCGDWVMPLAASAGRRTWMWWTALVLVGVIFVVWGLS